MTAPDIDTERKWWPCDLLDEGMPPGRAQPSDWIKGPAGDVYEVANGNEDDDARERGDVLCRVKPGDTLAFCYRDDLGEVPVSFHADGTFTPRGPVPAGFNWCWMPYDPDTISETLEALAELLKDAGEPGLVEVGFAFWSEHREHRLVVDAGGARFVEIDPSRRVQ
jgi:hypothetical protein